MVKKVDPRDALEVQVGDVVEHRFLENLDPRKVIRVYTDQGMLILDILGTASPVLPISNYRVVMRDGKDV